MDNFITTRFLNLRREPTVRSGNVLAVMPPDTVVERLSKKGDWFLVKATLSSTQLEGFAFQKFLKPTALIAPTITTLKRIPEVHLSGRTRTISRNGLDRVRHLNEPELVRVDLRRIHDPVERCRAIHEVVDFIDVEKSKRYAPGAGKTYCNIYAYDVAFCVGTFLPRVWWTREALNRIVLGEQVKARYGDTIHEMNANQLTDWFERFSHQFGWRREVDLTNLQKAVNDGKPGVIAAQRIVLSRSGHIVMVVPETAQHQAKRQGLSVTSPLQSQAGTSNKKYFSDSNWWENGSQFRKFGFWVWEGNGI